METETNPAAPDVRTRGVRCEVCGASLSDADELSTHMEGHAEQEAEGISAPAGGARHKCSLCDSTFETAEDLKAHLMSAHEK